MTDPGYIDVRELRDVGFLQEANRLFFHPHGLALAIAWAPTPVRVLSLTGDEFDRLARIVTDSGYHELAQRLASADRYDVGDAWIVGCWDRRDDPKGVVFGSDVPDKAAKAARVAAQRVAHHGARAALFGGNDIEPVDWTIDEGNPDA